MGIQILWQQALTRALSRYCAQHPMPSAADVRTLHAKLESITTQLSEARAQYVAIYQMATSPPAPPQDTPRQYIGKLSRQLANHRIIAMQALQLADDTDRDVMTIREQAKVLGASAAPSTTP